MPGHVIERILDTATHAPSAHNLQPWQFVMVVDAAKRKSLGVALTSKMRTDMVTAGVPSNEIDSRAERTLRRLGEAPVVVMLCRDVTAVKGAESEEAIMAIQSVASAGLLLLLAAHAEGLGGNWICWPLYAQEAAQKALDLPDTWEPQSMFFLGYGVENPAEKSIKPLREKLLVV